MRERSHGYFSLKEGHEEWRERAEASGWTASAHHVPQNSPWRSTPAGYSLSIQNNFLLVVHSDARETVYLLKSTLDYNRLYGEKNVFI